MPLQAIRATLENDPQYAELTRMDDGVETTLTPAERSQVIDDWAQSEFDVAEHTRIASNGGVSSEYESFRSEAYPSTTDQLDMQFHDLEDGTTVWRDTIRAVKTKFPKP